MNFSPKKDLTFYKRSKFFALATNILKEERIFVSYFYQ